LEEIDRQNFTFRSGTTEEIEGSSSQPNLAQDGKSDCASGVNSASTASTTSKMTFRSFFKLGARLQNKYSQKTADTVRSDIKTAQDFAALKN
jgi:anti-sigma factor RsiW